MSQEYHNVWAADWTKQNITSPVEIRRIGGSPIGKILTYLLCFSVPLAFIGLGVVAFAVGIRDRYVVGGSIFFGVLMLIPAAIIVLAGSYVRTGFAKLLDGDGVSGTKGRRFAWGKLYYVDHVTKHIRVGRVSRKVKDNQIELVFENGKVIIPPLIHDRANIWQLVSRVPAEVRDDGVVRSRDALMDQLLSSLPS